MTYNADTKVLRIDSQNPDLHMIHEAAEVIRAGRLVAFPTETVYGLGANALDSDAISRIYAAKRRPASDPVIAHIADIAQLDELAVNIPLAARELAAAFWAGPLTLILERAAHVPPNIATGLNTVAVRMPRHPVAHALIQASGVPIAAPSANTFTRPSATTAAHVLEDLEGRVDLVLDGGSATIGLESTVIDLTKDRPVVLRPGGITLDDLRRIVPDVILRSQLLSEDDAPSASPGQLIKHYSPRAVVLLFEGQRDAVLTAMVERTRSLTGEGKRVGVLTSEEDVPRFSASGARILPLGQRDDLDMIGKNLFAAMRTLDAENVDFILVHDFGREGLGAAIRDRLMRAAEGRIIAVES